MAAASRVAVFAALARAASSLDNGFPRPPLGWSALYGAPFSTVNETIMRAAAQGLVDGGFAAAGYSYVTLDDWYAQRDNTTGRMMGLPSTFPSGMRNLSDIIHGLGLKFGVYSAASQRTCGNFSASLFLETLDADTFANEWQIDFLKYDSCLYSNGVGNRPRYSTMRDALNATGRQIFYSMEGQAYFPDVGNMWRTGGDMWPYWDSHLLRNLYANDALASLFVPGAGAFNDPDHIIATGTESTGVPGAGLNFEEARSQFVLWAVMKAPLMLGVHYALLATMKTALPEYFTLLTHPEVIAVNQDISAAAVRRQSYPSSTQVASSVALTLQTCDATREDQTFVAAPSGVANMSAIRALHGNLCASLGAGGAVTAVPCDGSAAQAWGLLPDARFHVPVSGADESVCLTSTPGAAPPSAAPCEYPNGAALPPPFDANIGEQLWVWDSRGSVIHGASAQCLTLGVSNYAPQDPNSYTNNGTLSLEVWAGALSATGFAGKTVAVLFNKSPANDTLSVEWPSLGTGLPRGATLPIRDVYARADLPPATSLSALIPPHGVRIFIVG
jgi:hypothetical protein